MRLLQLQGESDLSFVDYYGKDIPPYAILSHTWGKFDEEVVFKDLRDTTYKSRASYHKLISFAMEAASDGLRFFWIDTCCIDKSNGVELTEAINSMFLWYRNAAKCYVYLSDVLGTSSEKLGFRESRWFTRGWTLQELIAPKHIFFFSREWACLGSKELLEQEIHEITEIPIQALRGSPLSQFSTDERMSWARHRTTRIEEDSAYSLMGIFGIYMPLRYGEGRRNAFERLWQAITIKKIKIDPDEIPDTDSEFGTDAPSIFSDGGISTSSKSSIGLNSVQTTGIREVSRALLSHLDLRALYATTFRNIEQRKARIHIRGFLKEYGQNLRKEASKSLEIQAAKFVQELAGRIGDEINWTLNGFQEMSRSLESEVEKKDLETWLSSLQPQSVDIEEKPNPPGLAGSVSEEFEEAESDDELDSSLAFPNIDQVKDFLLNSEAFGSHVEAMRKWLKGDGPDGRREGNPTGNIPVIELEEAVETARKMASYTPETDRQQEERGETPTAAAEIDSQQDIAHDPKSTSKYLPTWNSVIDLSCGLLDFWGIAFFFYDLVELLMPDVRPGYKRLRWRCSCNTVLWGDFPVDNDSTLNQLKRELSWWRMPFNQQASQGGSSQSQPNANSGAGGAKTINLAQVQSLESSSRPMGPPSASSSSQTPANISDFVRSKTAHVVNITFSPRFFEVCINKGNHAIDHHEIDISQVASDAELFELIWDKYKGSRGFSLRRLFLRPRDIHFVMFSVSRRNKYGTGIHRKPDEFPPQNELDKNRYHYLCPKIRMPVNVFLHYLHRARWNVWGEHTEDTWLKRLPKKLNESVLAEWRQGDATAQLDDEADSNLAFGWGVHILDGPNHAVLGILLAIGVTVAFVVSGMVVGFAKTQEQGFAVGSFLLAILASTMVAVYFQLQDQ